MGNSLEREREEAALAQLRREQRRRDEEESRRQQEARWRAIRLEEAIESKAKHLSLREEAKRKALALGRREPYLICDCYSCMKYPWYSGLNCENRRRMPEEQAEALRARQDARKGELAKMRVQVDADASEVKRLQSELAANQSIAASAILNCDLKRAEAALRASAEAYSVAAEQDRKLTPEENKQLAELTSQAEKELAALAQSANVVQSSR
jgi:hypothetical protein